MRIIILLFIAVITSCADNGSESNSTNSADHSLVGTWASVCHSTVNSDYRIWEITFDESGVRYTGTTFSDADCVEPNGEIDPQQGYYEIGEELTTESGLYARKLLIFIELDEDYLPTETIYRIETDTLYFGNNDLTDLNFDFYYRSKN